MKKFLLTILITFAASMGSMMYADFYEGACSESVFWNFESNTGVLTIYGEGDIPVYSEAGGAWVSQISLEDVLCVIIEEGITGIGDYAFMHHSIIEAIQIPSTVTYMGSMAFGYCGHLQTVVFKSAMPPSLGECVFCEIGQVNKFYVPVGSTDAYCSWGYCDYCTSIEEGEPSSIIPPQTKYTQLADTTVCVESLVPIGTCYEYVYYTTTLSCTLTSAEGGDSIVSRKVIVNNVEQPYIETQNIKGSATTGSIRFFDTYNYGEGGSEETAYRARYDYITVNGVRYDHSPSATESAVNIYDLTYATPSFELTDLQPGTYEIKFYLEDCSLATQTTTATVYFQYAYVDGLYYNSFTESVYEGGQYKEVLRAEVTHREYSESNSYSMAKVEIPDSITIGEKKYAVKRIGSSAFYNCTNLTSVTIPSSVTAIQSYAFSGCSSLKEIVLYPASYPFVSSNSFNSIASNAIFYVPMSSCSSYRNAYYWKNFNIQPAVKVNSEAGPTSCTLTFVGMMDEIVSCAIQDGETEQGNTLSYIGLEPNSTYSNVEFVVYNADNVSATLQTTFQTSALELVTLESKPTSNTSAILLAQTNLDATETRCGFEWKRNDAPADMAGRKEYATTANGIMAGRLMGLREDVYYKYRAFYESATGTMYYGTWQYIFTGDAGVEFEPIIYTESAKAISERGATLRGYALEGSQPITEQGFEYWAESRVRMDEFAGAETEYSGHSELGRVYTVEAAGIAMQATLTELEAGTLYKYRAYAKAGGVTYYGKEAAFVTQGAYAGEDVYTAIEQVTEPEKSQKILRDGQIYILRGDKTYTITGQVIK